MRHRINVSLVMAAALAVPGSVGADEFTVSGVHKNITGTYDSGVVEGTGSADILDGGDVETLTLYDTYVEVFEGGHVGEAYLYGFAQLNVNDENPTTENVSSLHVSDASFVEIFDGGMIGDAFVERGPDYSYGGHLTMSEGIVNGQLEAANSGEIRVYGDLVTDEASLIARNDGTVRIFGGEISGVQSILADQGEVHIFGGLFTDNESITSNSGNLTITDGFFSGNNRLFAEGESPANGDNIVISGGDIDGLEVIGKDQESTVLFENVKDVGNVQTSEGLELIHPDEISSDATRFRLGGKGTLSAEWQDGPSWSVTVDATTSDVRIIPEPSSLALAAVGGVVLLGGRYKRRA